MARKKKDPAQEATTAPAQEAPEQTTPLQEQEAHLDPGQFKDMDDATLQGLAQDLGLDPAAYENRDALIAAIAAVPVIPGPPEAEAEPEAPAPEAPAGTTPEIIPEPTTEATPAQEEDPAPEPDQVPPGERPTPYRAAVAVPIAVVHKEVGLGTADMLKAVGSLRHGTPVTVTGRKGTYAQLKNGLYILEALLEVRPIS